jgi:programmed cell death protein 5
MSEEEEHAKLVQAREQYAKQQEAERTIKQLARQLLDGAAYERLMNIRLANPELYAMLVQSLYGLYKQGQLQNKVNEEQLKQLAARLRPERRETRITRK